MTVKLGPCIPSKSVDRIPNNDVLAKAGMPSLFALLFQRRLCWLGHVRRVKDERIPKDTLYGSLPPAPDPKEGLSFSSKMSANVT